MLHRFLRAYVRYAAHVVAYLTLAADPYPGFTGRPGSYPIDVEIDPPGRQNRWVTGFRLFLALPAILLADTLLGFGRRPRAAATRLRRESLPPSRSWAGSSCVVHGRMPRGLPGPARLRDRLLGAGRSATCSCSPTAIRTATRPCTSRRTSIRDDPIRLHGRRRPAALAADRRSSACRSRSRTSSGSCCGASPVVLRR